MNESTTSSKWLDVSTAAKYLSVSADFLNKDRVSGLHGVPFVRLGRRILYDREQLDRFLESRLETACGRVEG